MRIFYKSISYILIVFISMILGNELLLYFEGFGLNGHDTYQYIAWSKIIFLDEKDLTFYRPVLYIILNFAHEIFGWRPNVFGSTLVIIYLISSIIFYEICEYNFKRRLLSILGFVLYLNAPFIINSLGLLYINLIEVAFITFFLFSLFYFFKKQNFFSICITAFIGFCLAHIHEDKFLIFVLPYIYLYCYQKNLREKIFKIFLIFFILSIFTLIFLDTFELIKSFQKGAGVPGTSVKPIILNFLANFLAIITNSTYPIYSNIFFISIIVTLIYFFKNFREENNVFFSIIFTIFSYLLIITIFYGDIQIKRVIYPIYPFLLILNIYFFNLLYKKLSKYISTFLIIILILFNSVIFYSNFYQKFKKQNDTLLYDNYVNFAFKFLKNNFDSNIKVLETASFERRIPGWGVLKDKYGLSSVVYFGNNADNTTYLIKVKNKNISKELILNEIFNAYDVIIYNSNFRSKEEKKDLEEVTEFDDRLLNLLETSSSFNKIVKDQKNIKLIFYVKKL